MKPGVKRRIGIADTHGNRRVTVSACLELVLSQVPSLMDQVLDGLRLAAVSYTHLTLPTNREV